MEMDTRQFHVSFTAKFLSGPTSTSSPLPRLHPFYKPFYWTCLWEGCQPLRSVHSEGNQLSFFPNSVSCSELLAFSEWLSFCFPSNHTPQHSWPFCSGSSASFPSAIWPPSVWLPRDRAWVLFHSFQSDQFLTHSLKSHVMWLSPKSNLWDSHFSWTVSSQSTYPCDSFPFSHTVSKAYHHHRVPLTFFPTSVNGTTIHSKYVSHQSKSTVIF